MTDSNNSEESRDHNDTRDGHNIINRLSHSATLWQMIRYGLVGVANTLLTLAVIWVMKGLLHLNPWTSNACGYAAGFINSFIWNKVWVFRSNGHLFIESVKFAAGFLACYSLQFLATWMLTNFTPMGHNLYTVAGFTFSGYAISTLIGMVVYTLANFIYNRFITFK